MFQINYTTFFKTYNNNTSILIINTIDFQIKN